MRAPNLHLHTPHLPHWRAPRVMFHRPTAPEAWAVALAVLLAAAMLVGLMFAISNPTYYTGEYTTYPLAPM